MQVREHFRVSRVLDFSISAKIKNSETLKISQDFTSFERINGGRIVWGEIYFGDISKKTNFKMNISHIIDLATTFFQINS